MNSTTRQLHSREDSTATLARPATRLLIFLVASLTSAPTFAAPFTCTTPPAGLVNWWPAAGNAIDIAGANNGTLLNGTAFAAGAVGQAFSFDGTNDFVQIGANPIPPPWTAEFWVNRQASLEDSAVLLGDTNTALKLEQWPGTKKVGFTLWNEANADHFFNYIAPTGTWVHLVFVGTTTNTQLYVNGALQGTTNVTFTLPRKQMGKDIPNRYEKHLRGLVDEISLYNRALASSEIQAIYSAGAAGKCAPNVSSCATPPAGLVNWWPAAGNANDIVGTNNGTLLNGTAFAAGVVGQAFSFDGTNDFVQIGADPIPPPWTAEFWVNRQASLEDSAVLLGDTNTALKLEQWPGTKKVGFTLWNEANADHFFNYIAPTGTWVHLVFVGTTTNTQLYVNGALQGTTNVSFTLPREQMGKDIPNRYEKHLKGLVDEASLYNRALSPNEIACLYMASAAGKCLPGPAPANNDFSSRSAIDNLTNSHSLTDSNLGATREPGESDFVGNGFGGRSVWYSHVPLQQGLLRVRLAQPHCCNDSYARYSIFLARGSTVSNLTEVSSPLLIDGGPPSDHKWWKIYADVLPGLEYQLAVDGAFVGPGIPAVGGNFTLELQFTSSPDNDNFEQRSTFSGNAFSTPVSLLAASRQPGEPPHGGGEGSLWWEWTAPFNGLATIRATQLGNFVPDLAVYQGVALANLSTVNSTIEVIGHTRQLRFQAVQGQTYAIALSGAKYDRNTFPQTSDALFGSGRFEFTFATLGIRISNLVATTNATDGVDFSATARIENFGSVTTGPLRFRLSARPGISKTEQLSGPNELPCCEMGLGVFAPPPPGHVAPGLGSPLLIGGTCPPPTNGFPIHRGIGWEVFCLLEEQLGTNWFLQDELLVLQGVWPVVGGYGGPGAGVIRLDPGLGGDAYDELLSVEILGPSNVYEGTRTAYMGRATYAEAPTYDFTNTIWLASRFTITTNGVLQTTNVTADTTVTITAKFGFAGQDYSSNRNIIVLNLGPPSLEASGSNTGGLFNFSLTGVLGRQHVIEATTNLSTNAIWIALATNALSFPIPTNVPLGHWDFVDPASTNLRSRFYRAREME